MYEIYFIYVYEMKEKWLKIKGYKGIYEISNMGNVRSIARRSTKGGILKPGLTGSKRKQYRGVVLCKGGIQKSKAVHRLVGTHFVPNPKKLTHLNHKNHNSLDNRAVNLKWTSNRSNVVHGKKSLHPGSIKQKYGYIAQIHVKGKTRYLGWFRTAKAASTAYKKALKKFRLS